MGKWPSIAEIRADWQLLATAFPFLALTVTLMGGESCEDNVRPIVTLRVADGQVLLMKPNFGDHTPPRRSLETAATMLCMLKPAQRERYPFREDVLCSWEKKAIEVDEALKAPQLDYPGVPYSTKAVGKLLFTELTKVLGEPNDHNEN